MKTSKNKSILLISTTALLSASLLMCSPPVEEKTAMDNSEKTETQAQNQSTKEKTTTDLKQTLKSLSTGEHRSDNNINRNQYRHPTETLLFFGVEPSMIVVEIWPGRGWYTEILAPFVNEKGQYYAAGFAQGEDAPEWRNRIVEDFSVMLAGNPELYANAIVTELAPPEKTSIAPEGSADRVLTFRNVHNWMKGDYADDVFAAMFKALKPGGELGVVEHRAKPETSLETQIQSGYVTEEHVKALAAKAGFEFVESSEINANPNDTADHPKGVWTLPPSLRMGDENKEKYLSIGESDRMTLKFKRPL